MGQTNVHGAGDDEQRRQFMRTLLRDVDALDRMLKDGIIESGVRRIGAEQEVALIDHAGNPAPVAEKILADLADESFTTELGNFNLEVNLDPLPMRGDSLRVMENQILDQLQKLRTVAENHDTLVALTGILPSIQKSDLSLKNLTNRPRYHALNSALNSLRGGPYELNISGTDELSMTHDSIMVEACNTSFQVHFQVDPEAFPNWYNIAQLATAPVLACAVNSPILLGRRLWRETRIAVFQQSIDTRNMQSSLREFPSRVSFGTQWVKDSVLEIFREDIARFKPLFHDIPEEDPFDAIAEGRAPRLSALCLHNGTVYRWNRACYGVTDGKPHLRIENRVLPSGPTPIDEVANTALWLGLMKGMHEYEHDITARIDFEKVVQNFLAAAREGLDSQLHWLDGQMLPAGALILSEILPIARKGLESSAIDSADIDRYLGVIEERVRIAQTGSSWILKSLSTSDFDQHRGPVLSKLTSAISSRQLENKPVHTWKPFSSDEFASDPRHVRTVGQFMITNLFTVREDDVVDLVTNLMEWRHIRQIPVEDGQARLVGMVTHRNLIQHLRSLGTAHEQGNEVPAISVSEIMNRDPLYVHPDTPTLDAFQMLKENELSCLPVVEDGKLVGLVTEHDIMHIAAPLLIHFLDE